MNREDLNLSLSLRRVGDFELNLLPRNCRNDSSSLDRSETARSILKSFDVNRIQATSDRIPTTTDAIRSEISRIPATPNMAGFDVNRIPVISECEEEAVVSSPMSTVSSLSMSGGKRDEPEGERASSRGSSDEEDGGEAARKKLRLSKDQSAVLEESFKEHNTLNPKQKLTLAKQLNLRPRQVEVWFQNRRARTKLKQTEVDCEFLKRCCENLTEENRRLQKEVMELRSLKQTPHFYMHVPPAALTMCPSCERVAVSESQFRPQIRS
ncbi:homeobox-leucine zipper protein ATHB-4 [Amborella trichopoda]|uniref:Homeobox domain-containing protein n=1 Tax=Amborella trichopoda TaxID=13333 RepID=U5DI27_AMBTC|nr:homeobox-leucine zipper protein ATHB-4 [Amborella trichopoda]ERN20228.1 hypothetical protein AMTR_s00066p00143040 [Amborella trichopoda]|eukprot:XP_006858761.1 homeobox-leucine zipper protein ATHB-4 [Amborella trichopoda]